MGRAEQAIKDNAKLRKRNATLNLENKRMIEEVKHWMQVAARLQQENDSLRNTLRGEVTGNG